MGARSSGRAHPCRQQSRFSFSSEQLSWARPMRRPANVPWGRRGNLGLCDGHRDQFSPWEPLKANAAAGGAWRQALASWPPQTRPHLGRSGSPEALAHGVTPSEGPIYHLVHGDMLAMVIQPDGHLRREAELPGGEERGPLDPDLGLAAWPRAPGLRPYLK